MYPSDQALSKVRDFIETRNFAVDGRIPPERTLAAELGVGRRSLRRALDVLEQEGRIHRHQGRGTFIDPRRPASAGSIVSTPSSSGRGPTRARLSAALDDVLDQTNPLEVIEVRLATEPVMARLAALRASQSEIKRLQTLAVKTRTASDADTYERADSLFHRTIAEAARNTLFLTFFDTMRASSARCRAGEGSAKMRTATSAKPSTPTFHDSHRGSHCRAQRPGGLRADAASLERRSTATSTNRPFLRSGRNSNRLFAHMVRSE